jgi:hypothetical protein
MSLCAVMMEKANFLSLSIEQSGISEFLDNVIGPVAYVAGLFFYRSFEIDYFGSSCQWQPGCI